MVFEITLRPAQLSTKKNPENQERFYQLTFKGNTIFMEYPTFRFHAVSLEEAKSFLNSAEYTGLRPTQ